MFNGGEAKNSQFSIRLQRLSTRVSSAQRKGLEAPAVGSRKPVPVDPDETTYPERPPGREDNRAALNQAAEADVSCEDHPECDFECYKCRDAWYRFTRRRPLAPEEEAELMVSWEAAAKKQLR